MARKESSDCACASARYKVLSTRYEVLSTRYVLTLRENVVNMEEKSIVEEKSFALAVRIVSLYKVLTEQRGEYVLSKQILRSGTSIGANIAESRGAQSDRDFLTKITIAYKEGRETEYWLELLKATGYLSEEEFQSIYTDCAEVCKIIAKAQITLKNRLT